MQRQRALAAVEGAVTLAVADLADGVAAPAVHLPVVDGAPVVAGQPLQRAGVVGSDGDLHDVGEAGRFVLGAAGRRGHPPPAQGVSRTPQLSLMLAVGRNQVQRWGGDLSVHSLAEGTTFRVRLPLVVAAEPERPPPRCARRCRGGSGRTGCWWWTTTWRTRG